MRTYPGSDPILRRSGTTAAVNALRGGRLVTAPADFHYAVLADAFSVPGVSRMREARSIPHSVAIPVFIHRRATMHALFLHVTPEMERLAMTFWPGPMTLVGTPQPSLVWEAGTAEAVAVRMPLHPWALELVAEVGPLTATGAQARGNPPASRLGDCWDEGVSIALDGGELPGGPASTVVDTRAGISVAREGAIAADDVHAAIGEPPA